MLLKDSTEWNPDDADIINWVKLYPAVEVYQELNAMEGWLDANPTKRKTVRGMKRFVNSWLSRAQDKGGSSNIGAQHGSSGGLIVKTRDMTSLDEVTHDFMGSEAFRQKMLVKHGQYFKDGKRVTAYTGEGDRK